MPALLRDLKKFYTKNRRDLPWRHTRDPYHILVSEVMLQQTQASRVVPFYTKFIKKFPTAKALATAPLSSVLQEWQGLGYNRRAKYLHSAAKMLSSAKYLSPGEMNGTPTPSEKHFASLSLDYWQELPGVGPYTARAVVSFAYNKPTVFIETNIRTVFTHYLFPHSKKVDDKKLFPLIEKALAKSNMQPRDFYAALMDYGSYLKQSGVRINSKSKHYVKQSKFEGSARQLRGAILRELLKKPLTVTQLQKKIPRKAGELKKELTRLEQEGLLKQSRERYFVD